MQLYYDQPHLFGNPHLVYNKQQSKNSLLAYKNMQQKQKQKLSVIDIEKRQPLQDIIYLWWGDLTKLHIQCIVNSANMSLKSGGGLCGAIHRTAGKQLQQEIKHRFPTGITVTKCVLTQAYDMSCDCIIHAVGPSSSSKLNSNHLSQTYVNILNKCLMNNIRSVCFCCIGCGTHFLSIQKAAKVAVETCIVWLLSDYKVSDFQSKAMDMNNNGMDISTNNINIETKNEEIEENINVNINSNKIETDTEVSIAVDEYNLETNVKKRYMMFDRIVFNCGPGKEAFLEVYKHYLAENLGTELIISEEVVN